MKVSRKDGQVSEDKECGGTSTYTFLNLIQDILFLKDGSNYYICKFEESGSSLTKKQLSTSEAYSAVLKEFYPYNVVKINQDVFITVAVNYHSPYDGKFIIKYKYDSNPSLPAELLIDPDSGIDGINPSFLNLKQISGGQSVFYHQSQNKIFYLKKVNNDQEFIQDTNTQGLKQAVLTGYTVKIYQFMSPLHIITTRNINSGNPSQEGKAWKLQDPQSTVDPISQMTVTGTIFSDYSNNLYSLGRVTSNQMVWLYYDSNNNKLLTGVISNPAGSGETFLGVSFSKDKAIVLSESSKISLYKMMPSGTVENMFSTQPLSEAVSLTNNQEQFRVSLKCLCEFVKMFNCFATTLNCLLLSKATKICDQSSVLSGI